MERPSLDFFADVFPHPDRPSDHRLFDGAKPLSVSAVIQRGKTTIATKWFMSLRSLSVNENSLMVVILSASEGSAFRFGDKADSLALSQNDIQECEESTPFSKETSVCSLITSW